MASISETIAAANAAEAAQPENLATLGTPKIIQGGDRFSMATDAAAATAAVAGGGSAAAAAAAAYDAASNGAAPPPDFDAVAVSTELKGKGNEKFKAGHFDEAAEFYSQAIAVHATAVLHSNRAFCYLKTEAFGLAQSDAEAAIRLDKMYIKGYYRLGSAHLALGRYKAALKQFKRVCKIAPKSRDARAKFKACKAAVRKQAFEAAIASEQTRPDWWELDPSKIEVEAGYDGPRLAIPEGSTGGAGAGGAGADAMGDDEDGPAPLVSVPVPAAFAQSLLEYYKNQKRLHRRFMLQMLLQARAMFDAMPSLTDITVPKGGHLIVCGDTHGQFFDLCNIFELGGMPSADNPYLFNGDFVDRGSWSLEVIATLLAFKLADPRSVHLARGNHETTNMNKIYGFEGEVKHKYDMKVMGLFTEIFNCLPLASCITGAEAGKVFVTHGGLFKRDGVTLDEIRKVDRKHQPPDEGLMSDMLWSDPQPFPGRGPSKRGVGQSFGPDITKAFCETNGLDLIVRSHEVKQEGYLIEHDGKCITVFSAPNYCDQMGNKGAFITFDDRCAPQFTKFSSVPHPPIKPMAYASPLLGMM